MKTSIENFKSYHSDFKISTEAGVNHILRLRLGICVQKVTGVNIFRDFDNNSFKVREWTQMEWYNFRDTIFEQSEMWNNQFWLVPPKNFNKLDVPAGDIKFRPNIKCELFVQVWNNPGSAQMNIKVAKLDDTIIGDSAKFRSDAVTYDSLDGVAHTFRIPDKSGDKTEIKHYTIPHEIGHALGQPHIGVLRKTEACQKAIDGNPDDKYSKGGSNSNRCYGWGEPPNIAENIMGYGTKFAEVNAEPWRKRIAEHTATKAEDWKVVMFEVPPCLTT